MFSFTVARGFQTIICMLFHELFLYGYDVLNDVLEYVLLCPLGYLYLYAISSHCHRVSRTTSYPFTTTSPNCTSHSPIIFYIPWTNIMSPERNSIYSSPEAAPKPYTKALTPITLPTLSWPVTTTTSEFPTRAQYQEIESNYLTCLSPRRQGKALISQSIFDRIWDVLHNSNSQAENPQFRFWARKMFTLSNAHGFATTGTPQEVLLHDGLLVAVQEQIYDLLCYCHASTNHGGRDKTCALIRKYYTWVPKDLVASFVKACPTCLNKKGGSLGKEKKLATTQGNYSSTVKTEDEETRLPQLHDPFQSTVLAAPRPLTISPRHSILPPLQEREESKAPTGSSSIISPCALLSRPMVRECTLYKGLPNGWQTRHKDYASAHAEFMELKNNIDPSLPPGPRRKRIPSIAPLWGPDRFPAPEEASGMESLTNISLPSITDDDGIDPLDSSLPEALLPLLITRREVNLEHSPENVRKKPYFQGKGKASGSSRPHGPKHGGILVNDPSRPSLPLLSMKTSASTRHPRLSLDTEMLTEMSFQKFLNHRDNPASSDGDSPTELQVDPSYPSLLSESGSGGYAMSTTSSLSPASTALPTPLDECFPGKGFNETFLTGKYDGKREDNLSGVTLGLESALMVLGH